MNIWALKKDIPLKILLLEIVHRYGENILTLNPDEENFQAIDIFLQDDPTLSAYIYTFGQNPKCYGIDLRYPIKVHNIVGENENLSLYKTIEVIAIHLFS
jgi:hypothetical protein